MYRDDSLLLASLPSSLANETLALLGRRFSTRAFAEEQEAGGLSDGEKDTIIKAALRAPTAGNLLAYSIIDITDDDVKQSLSKLCDNQLFIARAPLALVFVADYYKWSTLFQATDCMRHAASGLVDPANARLTPGLGAFMLAVNDAVIAAQNAVVAAESLGIGSCYIGDIMEQGPRVAELLELPEHTFPAAFVVFGRAKEERQPTPHYIRGAVMANAYKKPTDDERAERIEEMTAWAPASRMSAAVPTYPESVFVRKHASSFMADMNASVQWWLERWIASGEEQR